MGRRINTVSYQATGGGSVDGYFDKIIKYIPSDIVAAWTAAIGIITGGQTTSTQSYTPLWIAFVVGIGLTAAWTWYQTNAPNQPLAIRHITASTISFVVWAFALPIGPASALQMDPKWGSLLLIGWTLVLGIIKPDPTNPTPPPPVPPGP